MSVGCGDGFDYYPTSKLLGKWDYVGAGVTGISTSYGRFAGSQGCRIAGGFATIGQSALGKNLPATNTGWGFFGHAIYVPVMPSSGYLMIHAVYDLAASGGMKLCTLIGADGSLHIGYITVNNFSTTVNILQSSPSAGLVSAATWYYVESGFNIKTAAGGGIIRLSAADPGDAGYVTYTGNTVRSTGSNFHADSLSQQFTHVRVGGTAGSGTTGTEVHDIDDFYYCDSVDDGLLPPTNTFLGDVRLGALQMIGAGSLTGLTPVGAVSNWDCVNDAAAPDDLASYVAGATVGLEDLYEMENMPTNARTVFAMLINARVAKDDATVRTYNTRVKPTGSSVSAVATRTAPSSFVNQQDVSQSNPATSARYTPSDVNALEVGIRIAS